MMLTNSMRLKVNHTAPNFVDKFFLLTTSANLWTSHAMNVCPTQPQYLDSSRAALIGAI
eukprot:CAMPEP_0180810558 /NCGR_PEP_ID=MMETSP1038_2-20121128/64949_1 /TAXON_ID=632150 /ORGANISM="Azadinium spinosum, Strain 3D9" /LENGTH=58 /DNA_ID=CAMNT_0022851857 /DNA_START=64 /DNA_END=237 /DNA_ORIENTATION=-